MKQIFIKHYYTVGFGATTQNTSLMDGHGAPSLTFDPRISIPIPGTFSRLVVQVPGAHPELTVIFMINNVPTALRVIVPIDSNAVIINNSEIVTIAAGDSVGLRFISGSVVSSPGYDISVSVEWNGTENIYGVSSWGGSITVGNGRRAGALGNGVFETANAPISLTSEALTKSISGLEGNLTRLHANSYRDLEGGTWTLNIIKNTVLQDGSGGSVDTTCVLSGATLQNTTEFTLPVSPLDVIEILAIRGDTNASFGTANCSVSVTLDPTVPGSYMFCGGSNDAILVGSPSWVWTRGVQSATAEDQAASIIGPLGLSVSGMYIERAQLALSGTSTIYTLRKNNGDTILVTQTDDANRTASILGDVSYEFGDFIDIQYLSPTTTSESRLYWSIPVIVPPSSGGGIYVPDPILHDKIIVRTGPIIEIVDVRIPAHGRTAFIGDR